MNQFWEDLGVRLATTVIITPIAVGLWKACEYGWHLWYNRQLRKQAERHAAAHGVRQVVLTLSVGEDIEESVRGYLKQEGLLGGSADIPILKVHQPEALSENEGQWYAFLERVKREVRRIREEGFTRLHVFARLPVPLAAMVGATLTNGPTGFLYHFSGGRYFRVGQITFETVKLS